MKRFLILTALTFVVALIFLELFARHKATYILTKKIGDGSVSHYSQEIHIDGPRGSRLPPNANLIVKNHYLSRKDIPLQTNRLGLRDQELVTPKPANEKRILVLGDSITFGDGVEQAEVWLEQLEKMFNAEKKHPHFQFVNGGICGTGLNNQVDLLEDLGESILPDGLILAFYLNDSRPSWGFRQEKAYQSFMQRHSVFWNQLVRSLAARQWIKEKGDNLFAWVGEWRRGDWRENPSAFHRMIGLAKYDWGSAWLPDSWEAMEKDFLRLKAYGTKNKIPVLMVVFPVAMQVDVDFLEDAPQQVATAIAQRHGFQFFDLLPFLRSAKRQIADPLYFDHCHLTPLGHQVVGKALAPKIPALITANP